MLYICWMAYLHLCYGFLCVAGGPFLWVELVLNKVVEVVNYKFFVLCCTYLPLLENYVYSHDMWEYADHIRVPLTNVRRLCQPLKSAAELS